jgi:hypothetical protein
MFWANPSQFFVPAKPNQQSRLDGLLVIYFICYGNEFVSSSLSDVQYYTIIRNLLDPIFYILLVLICWLESQIHLHRVIPHMVAYTRYDVHLFIKWMDFKRSLIGYDKWIMNWKAFWRHSKFDRRVTLLHSDGIRFESRPGHQLSWLTSCAGFFSPFRRISV